MAAVIHLDTHVVAWLYAGRVDLLPRLVRDRLEIEDLVVSPAVMLELEYLFEIGRVSDPSASVLADLFTRIGMKSSESRFDMVVRHATGQKWTRDPFDRLIVAQALLEGADLVTKDRTIRANYGRAVWE